MRNLNYKSYFALLSLLTAVSGIAMFITLWNNFLLIKERSFLSLFFLILFLTGLVSIYFLLTRILMLKEKPNLTENPVVEKESAQNDKAKFDRDNSFSLLKGVSNRSDIKTTGEKILKNLATEFEIVQGVFFILDSGNRKYTFTAAYANSLEFLPRDFETGEGITGQAAENMKIMFVPNIPESNSPVISGLGKGKAHCLYIIPLVYDNRSIAVIEISCFKEIEENRMTLLHHLMREGGSKLYSQFFADKK